MSADEMLVDKMFVGEMSDDVMSLYLMSAN
jgi:hypothetical protein